METLQGLYEEGDTDKTLTDLAMNSINVEAMEAA